MDSDYIISPAESDRAPCSGSDFVNPSSRGIDSQVTITIPLVLFVMIVVLLTRKRYATTLLKFYRHSPTKNGSWRDVVTKKLAADREKIPKKWLLSPEVIERGKKQRKVVGGFIESLLDEETWRITNMDAPELIDLMSQGMITAVQVVSAFCKRAAYAHQICDLLLEIGFDLALSQARELDHYFVKHKKLMGPLHGLPFTMKDQFHIKGMETTAAYVGWIGTFQGQKDSKKYKLFESELVRELKSLGAIPIGKTTLATGTWSAVTNNNILGYAFNPHNQLLSTGGSSGGEAAMQALRGSCFGFGTDIGGSVSMPASYQGIYSLKPSEGRISFQGGVKISPGQLAMSAVVGVMGPSIEVLRLVFKSLLSTQPWFSDSSVTRMPWQGSFDGAQSHQRVAPAFGFLENDGIVTPHPPVARAMRIVKRALEKAGSELVDWRPPKNDESIAAHAPLTRGNACLDVWNALMSSGEPLTPELKLVFPKGRPKDLISLVEYEEAGARMIAFRDEWQQYWKSSSKKTKTGLPVQAVISPVAPYVGITRHQSRYSAYSSSMNVLDYPSIVIRVTVADQDVDEFDAKFEPLTCKDAEIMETYKPRLHHGNPVNIQLIGRKQGEEDLFAMAQFVMDAVERYAEETD